MTEPMSTDRVFELLALAKHEGLSLTETAELIADASEDGGPGLKPEDYLTIHLNDKGRVNVSLNTHYVNHGGTWVSCNTEFYTTKELPEPGYSQFVCIDLSELGLKREDNWLKEEKRERERND